MRASRFRIGVSALGSLIAALALANAPAQAQTVRPFFIKGSGLGPDGLPLPGQPARPHWAYGDAMYLGDYYGEGTVQTDSAVYHPENGTFTGEFGGGSPFVFYGQYGDKLVTWYGRTDHGAARPGTFTLTIVDVLEDGSLVVKAAWLAQFVVVPDQSTGVFAGVTGSWSMHAYSEPFVLGSSDPVNYCWIGRGELTFPKKKPGCGPRK